MLPAAVVAGWAEETPPRFRAMYEDAVVFEMALAAESASPPAGHRVTGITVPHHLVAADLIARGSGGSYERKQTMNALVLGDAEAIAGLRQPNHFDSKAAQFVQMVLQRSGHDASCRDR